ncbi:MAG: uncharacterized protein KVP18_004970 [Porospora cf. gigantea A]|uniref:uncharacterized protein n=1 Tax=Porospora cf. gigantea A TaxID=2853593 RepID=UPI00355A9880|nr:MAG: hypothetical protein KVP18_004970 [Porospora cf. gigantea A]
MLLYHLVATQLVALTREPLGMKLPLFVVRFVSAVICAALLLESILLWLVAVPNLVVLVAAAVFPRLCWLCPNDVWVDQTFCYVSDERSQN